MKADLIKRLERLERYIPPAAPENEMVSYGRRIVRLVLAYDRGGLQEHEATVAGFSRALGYHGHEGFRLFKEDLKNDTRRISERHGKAIEAFFAAHGLDPEVADVDEKLELIGRLYEQMPESLRARIDS
jgi:hypothetical protein